MGHQISLNKNAVGTTLIKNLLERKNEELTRKISQDHIQKELLFTTPKEAQEIIKKYTKTYTRCDVDDLGFLKIKVLARINDMMTITCPQKSNSTMNYATGGIYTGNYSLSQPSSTSDMTTTYSASTNFDSHLFVEAIEKLKLNRGSACEIELPDGAIIKLDEKGDVEVLDDNAKIIYKGCPVREFNRYVNASDLLQDFIRFVGSLGVRQSEVLNIPIELFINWLIFKAAEQDNDQPPEDLTPPQSHPKLLQAKNCNSPKCLYCGRFIRKDYAEKGFNFCDGVHASQFVDNLVS